MKPAEGEGERNKVSRLMAGVRLDLVIAVCALLISTLATAASWWQTRATYQQTQIIEEQLSAQVWPYVGFSEAIVKSDTVAFTIENDGLGPAIVRSMAVFVDGKERSSYIGLLHAILGPGLQRRHPPGESFGLEQAGSSPGFVLRPGVSNTMFTFRSKTFAATFIRAYRRISLRACYCAIVPGRCWQTDTSGESDPRAVSSCAADPHDLLHAPDFELLFQSL